MPSSQERRGVYVHSFPVVTAAIWDKYEGHEFVKDVTVLDRWEPVNSTTWHAIGCNTFIFNFNICPTNFFAPLSKYANLSRAGMRNRSVDEKGRLHSKRLLTMLGNPPRLFRPFFGRQPFFLMESVVIDMKLQVSHPLPSMSWADALSKASNQFRQTPIYA